MVKIKRYVKDWLILGSVIFGLIAVIIMVVYFYQTGSDLADKNIDWGEFGSVVGAISGFIAFIGVLFTLRQNKQQFLNSEDRSVFFELLRIFISYRDTLRVKRIDWEYDSEKFQWKITPYNEFVTPEKTYRQIYVELYHTFYLEIRRGIPRNFSKEEFAGRIIPKNMSEKQWMLRYSHLAVRLLPLSSHGRMQERENMVSYN